MKTAQWDPDMDCLYWYICHFESKSHSTQCGLGLLLTWCNSLLEHASSENPSIILIIIRILPETDFNKFINLPGMGIQTQASP